MRVVSQRPAGKMPVYDIGVPRTHNFVLGNGLVAHNCFNKSHSISYSVITYLCAYFKANYPTEFFCALMTTRSSALTPKDWGIKAPEYLHEAKALGVDIRPPDVNHSELGFTIQGNGVYFGLNAIRDVGITAVRSIMRARKGKPFKSVSEFLSRVDTRKVTTKVFQALALAGAFDELGYNRRELYEKTGDIYQYFKDMIAYEERKREIEVREQERAEIEPIIERKKELKRIQRLKRERDLTPEELEWLEEHNSVRQKPSLQPKEKPTPPSLSRNQRIMLTPDDLIIQKKYVGCYVGHHPAPIIFPNAEALNTLVEGYSTICGEVVAVKSFRDKRGGLMAFLTIGDGRGKAEIVVFSSTYEKLPRKPAAGDIVLLEGKVEESAPSAKMIANRIHFYRSQNEF